MFILKLTFLGIAEVQNIYSATCYIQKNIQKVTITMQSVLLKFPNDYRCKFC